MKNSLFKRAIAAAAAVPLALTQCLSYANAVSVGDVKAPAQNVQAESEELTLDKLLYIAPSQTVSTWNFTVTAALDQLKGKSGEIDLAPYVDDIVAQAGQFGEVANVILTKYIVPNGATYEITADNDIIIKGKVSSPKQYAPYKYSPGAALENVGKKYGDPSLNDKTTFESVDVSGDVILTIKTSELRNVKGTTVPVQFEYKTADGSYGIGQLPEFAKKKVAEIQKVGEESIKKNIAADKVDAAIADYQAAMKKLSDKLDYIDGKIDSLLKVSKEGTYANVAGIITDLNAELKDKGINKEIPATATDIANNKIVSKVYSEALDKVDTEDQIKVTAAELGGFADSVKNIEFTLANGVAKGIGTFDDAEKADVIAYYADGSQGFTVTDSYKKITATVDYSGIKSVDAGLIDVQIERVLETQTTTTTTTTTTSSTTTTTTTTDETTTTTTDETTTTTEETTTTTTEETTTTTITSIESTTSSTSTTTQVVTSIVKKYVDCQIDPAFYLSIEDQFDKTQVSDIKVHTFYDKITKTNEGDIVESNIEEISLLSSDNVSYGSATPSNTYTKGNKTFKYEIPVLFDGEKLTDAEGNDVAATVYIGVKGDANLNSGVDAVDASQVLRYYALNQTGQADKVVQLSQSELVTDPTSIYDEFAAFLADVNAGDNVTRYTKKAERLIDARDASQILAFYAKRQSSEGDGKTDAQLWNEVSGKQAPAET